MDFDITPFDEKKHERKGFDCGTTALNEYLLTYADEDVRVNAASLFVATIPESNEVLGYYTLTNTATNKGAFSVESTNEDIVLKEDITTYSKYPYKEIPTVLLGRLAVRESMQHKGLGRELVADAIIRSLKDSSAWAMMVIDPKIDSNTTNKAEAQQDKEKRLIAFYEGFGFASLPAMKKKTRLFASKERLKEKLLELGLAIDFKREVKILVTSEIIEKWETVAKAKGLSLSDFIIKLANDGANNYFSEHDASNLKNLAGGKSSSNEF